MEAAIRWSPHAPENQRQFLIVDVAQNRLQLCEIESLESRIVRYKMISLRDKLPNYTAFDWSKTQPYVVAVGSQSGEANVVRIDPDHRDAPIMSFPIKHQRKCNTIAFNTKEYVATGLDRVRNDHCMNIYDLKGLFQSGIRQTEPYRKLASSEPISSIKFFTNQPDTLVCGVTRHCIRIFDVRDSNSSGAHQFFTRQVHNLSIDPLDENYFVSAGPSGEPIVSVWDRRMASRSTPASTPSSEVGPQGPILEIRPAVENSNNAAIWALRYSGAKRGCFGVLSSTGEIKMVEISQHIAKAGLDALPMNSYGGNPWSSTTYIKRTHNLSYPWYDQENGRDESSRIVGFDFISPGIVSQDVAIMALHPGKDREVELMKTPSIPRKLGFTALDEIYTGRIPVPTILPTYGSQIVAKDLQILQNQARESKGVRRSSQEVLQQTTARLGNMSMENFGHKAPPVYETALHPSSGDQHVHLLTLWFPEFKPSIGDALKVLRTQRRRCAEGYQLNPQRNKEVVANDPWLVDMWDTIKRFEDMARNGGMVASGMDISYLGVFAIWSHSLGTNRNRNLDRSPVTPARFISAVAEITNEKDYPAFRGHKTKFPAHRQLCLALCGWTFSKDRLRTYCRHLMDNSEYYKAVVLAVMRGFKDLAQELLRSAIQQKALQNIGLGAVIACETVNSEQRDLCEWMADETDDPYLKALLNYFIKGDWKVVADMTELALSDRVGVALKYLDDERLDAFIRIRTSEAVVIGNIEGLVLTGLTDQTLKLFSNYIKKFHDLQTAVLAMSFACPLYLDDPRFDLWKETYKMQLQTWRAFKERTSYMENHAKLSRANDGRMFATMDGRPETLRCNHCLGFMGPRIMKNSPDGSITTLTQPRKDLSNHVAMKNGQLCSHCGHRTPICGICNLQLANPDPRRLNAATARKLAEDDPIAKQAVHCQNCTHSFHGNHARDWFARHKECPVPACGCLCALKH